MDSDAFVPKLTQVRWDDRDKVWYQWALPAPDDSGSLIERLDTRIYSPSNKPKEPPTRFLIGNIGVCTPGNITTISAQPKAGKSAAIGGMIASTFADDGKDCLGFISKNSAGLAVVHFDTEQCPYDHWQLINRALRRAGVSVAPDWLQSFCVTGFSHVDICSAIRLSLERANHKFGGIHSFILDGAADAIADVNDAAESNKFVAEIHSLAIEYDCPIIGVIHLNPGSDKTRGHLGSQLERKAETNLKLEKDDGEVSLIWADKNRRAPISKNSGPCFTWDDDARMHVTVENPCEAEAEAKRDAKVESMFQEARAVFAGGNDQLRHTDLVYKMTVSLRMSEVGAKKKLAKWKVSQVVTVQPSGLYAITQ